MPEVRIDRDCDFVPDDVGCLESCACLVTLQTNVSLGVGVDDA